MVGGRLRLRSGSAPIPRNAQPQLNAGPAHVVANFLPCPQLLRCWLLLTDSVSLQNAWPGLLLLPSKILAAASMAESAALVVVYQLNSRPCFMSRGSFLSHAVPELGTSRMA